MRRRQIFAAKAEEESRLLALRLAEVATEIAVSLEPKGTCPKCRKHIGRGVAFHAKKCQGLVS